MKEKLQIAFACCVQAIGYPNDVQTALPIKRFNQLRQFGLSSSVENSPIFLIIAIVAKFE